jgi:hypothetical protein
MSDSSRETPPPHEVAIFSERGEAQAAVRDLLAAGFPAGAISLFVQAPVKDEARASRGSPVSNTVEVGGEAGAGLGAAAGGLGGVLAGFGLLAIPGVGPVLAMGPLAAALTGAITGGALGGFAGSLIGEGVTEAEAIAAEHHVKAGRAVVVLQGADRREAAWAILRANGAVPPADDARPAS